jgi:anti-sigma regulatory factor (Ser/Thr protein kinase)
LLLHLDSQPNQPILCLDTIGDRPGHFDKLFRTCHEIAQLSEDCLDITIDFNYCEFIGHSGVAFLGGLAHLIKKRGGRVKFNWDSLRPEIHMNLAQNGFLYHFGYGSSPWDGNSIPYRSDLKHNATALGDYLRYKWLGRGWVNISSGLQEAIAGQVSEIYCNAFDHSQSEIGVFSCGQHYPNKGMLHLTVIDFGIGIPACVRSLPQNAPFTTEAALSWAFQSGTTTKQNGISRGLGLNLLQDFVAKNHGNLMIFSNDGYVAIDDNGIRYENKDINFSGTLVNIALRCDQRYYCLASEAPSIDEPLF